MAGFGDLFGKGSTAEQFLIWGVLQQLLQPILAPFTAELGKLMLEAAPTLPVGADVAAAAAARGKVTQGKGEGLAAEVGIDAQNFALLTKVAEHAPDLSMAFELYRRGKIELGSGDSTQATLLGAFRDAGIPDDWATRVVELAVAIPTPQEVMNALLEGQIPRSEALARWKAAGGDPTWFQSAYDSEGQAPTPMQALELWNRGIIPEGGTGPGAVSYEQAFLEGPWRNKWLKSFKALREYLPPPRTVTAMYHDGSLTHDEAAALLRKQGLSDHLIPAYLSKKAATTHTTEKHLAKGEITKAYADGLFTKAQATKALVDLTYQPADAALILALVDVHTKTSQLNSGVTRVRSLVESGQLTEAEALPLLGTLGVDAGQARSMLATWRLLATHKTRDLTAAQIESAAYYGFIGTTDAIGRLVAMGYTAGDAWLAMAVRFKGTTGLPPRPAELGPVPPKVKPPS